MIKVSIVMSNYYKREFVKECYDSILAQTFKNWELIVVDDTNGKDKLGEIIPDDGEKTKLHLLNDVGLSKLRNYGARVSSSQYLLFIDADDKLHPEFLEKTVACLDNNHDYSIAYTDTQHFGESNGCWESPEYNFSKLLLNNFMCSCSLMRRYTFEASGGYNEKNFNYWEDYEFWIKAGSLGFYGKHIPEKLFYYRVHSKSGTQSERDAFLAPYYKCYIICQFPNIYPPEATKHAQSVLDMFPKNFISLKPHEQEGFLKAQGLIK